MYIFCVYRYEQGINVYVALTPSTKENGCLAVIPQSHLKGKMSHINDIKYASFLSPNGSRLSPLPSSVSEDEKEEVENEESSFDKQVMDVKLDAGEISIHHPRIFHQSLSNNTQALHVGLSIRYLPTRASPQYGNFDYATLVNGFIDKSTLFKLENRPEYDVGKKEIEMHATAVEKLIQNRGYSSYFN